MSKPLTILIEPYKGNQSYHITPVNSDGTSHPGLQVQGEFVVVKFSGGKSYTFDANGNLVKQNMPQPGAPLAGPTKA